MTFVSAITALADRFLTERSFDLIVAPALADFELDSGTSRPRRITPHLAVIRALLGAFRDDALRAGDIGTFAGLVLIPVSYYSFFFLLGLPNGMGPMPLGLLAAVGVAVVTLSLAPVIVCYWPDRQPRTPSAEP